MNQQEAARRLGKSGSYFHVMKITCPKHHRVLMLLGKGDIYKGYLIYEDLKTDIVHKMVDLYFTYERKSDFAEILTKYGFYKNVQSAISTLGRSLFIRSINYNTTIKFNKILKKLKKDGIIK